MIDRACISLGEQCNLKCAYCHFHNEDNGKLSGIPQEFTTDELIKIAKKLNDYARVNNLTTFKIGIVGSGEPILQYRKIVGLIEYVKNNNLDRL
ncbi:radical SAM protein, partial [Vibrio harveyi]|nr:radical SAM protein [Vibrio harveyi]